MQLQEQHLSSQERGTWPACPGKPHHFKQILTRASRVHLRTNYSQRLSSKYFWEVNWYWGRCKVLLGYSQTPSWPLKSLDFTPCPSCREAGKQSSSVHPVCNFATFSLHQKMQFPFPSMIPFSCHFPSSMPLSAQKTPYVHFIAPLQRSWLLAWSKVSTYQTQALFWAQTFCFFLQTLRVSS